MKWSELSAREIDALVAERVMGWTMVQMDFNPGPFGLSPISDEQLKLLEPGEKIVPVPVPRFSSDIAAAWEVVERLKDGPETYGLELTQNQGELMEWIASFGNGKFIGEGMKASDAICLAALRACGVEIE